MKWINWVWFFIGCFKYIWSFSLILLKQYLWLSFETIIYISCDNLLLSKNCLHCLQSRHIGICCNLEHIYCSRIWSWRYGLFHNPLVNRKFLHYLNGRKTEMISLKIEIIGRYNIKQKCSDQNIFIHLTSFGQLQSC